MKIIIAHNSYILHGGEDVMAEQEANLLRENGNSVVEYRRSNREIEKRSMGGLSLLLQTVWASDSRRDLRELLRREKPDLAHFHNTFMMISPSAYYACKEYGVPVVQTVHNYRLLCLRGDLFRGGKICEECVGKTVPYAGMRYRCYHGSLSHSAAVASMLLAHRALRTWERKVDLFIAPSAFLAGKLVQGGIPAEKIVVKPNFAALDTSEKAGRDDRYAIYLGRLSPEKGVRSLIAAWQKIKDLRLLIVGAGPEEDYIRATIRERNLRNVEMTGPQTRDSAVALLKSAAFLVFPSQWHEPFGLVAVEAFASGVPVIAARAGAISEIVQDGHSGLLFAPGSTDELVRKVRWSIDNPEAIRRMGENARRVYEERYTPEKNYPMLMKIYHRAMARSSGRKATA